MIGIERFVKETGIEVKTQLGPDWEQANETANVQALAAMGYKPFAICPADGNAARTVFQELKNNGIPIVNFCIPVIDPNPADVTILTDVADAAKVGTEALIQAMGGKGRILNVLDILSDTNTAIRKIAVEEVVAKYPDVTIIQEVADIKTVEEGVQKVGNALSGNVERIDGIISTGFTSTLGLAQTLTDYYSRGGTKKIVAVGIDYDDVIIKAIRDGILYGTIAQNPEGQSYLACHIMKLMTEGWKVRDGKQQNINSGASLVTKDNLDTFQNDIAKRTDAIKAELETKYLTKN
jgi:ribose transport system substrate-binding protein